MCQGSIHVAHRNAKTKEKLVLRNVPGHGNTKGLYPANPKITDQRLVCVRGTKTVILDRVTFDPAYARYLDNPLWAPIRALEGKRNVQVTLNYDHGDYVKLPGCNSLAVTYLASGTKLSFGYPKPVRKPRAKKKIKITGDKGVALINKGIDVALKTEPTIKAKGARRKLAAK